MHTESAPNQSNPLYLQSVRLSVAPMMDWYDY